MVVRLSHSSIQSFLRCPRLWYLQYILGISPIGARSRPLEMGDAIHQALEVWWTGEGSTQDRLDAAVAAFNQAATELSFEDRTQGPVLLQGYAAQYSDDELRYQGLPLAEQKLELPVLDPDGNVDPRMVLVAKMDVVGYDELGNTVLVEHKSTASDINTSTFWNRFSNSLQLPLYWIAATDCYRRPTKLIVDVVRAPIMHRAKATPIEKRKFRKRDDQYGKAGEPLPGTRLRDETTAEFAARAAEAVLENPFGYFTRREYTFTGCQIAEARADVWAVGNLMLEVIAREGASARNSDGCEKYGELCGFHAACYGGADLADTRLYQVRTK